LKERIGLVLKRIIPVAGHVELLNKFKNEFDRIQTPQEIAGFSFPLSARRGVRGEAKINCSNLCKLTRIESLSPQYN
jgi:hypothetical protein